MTLHRTTNLCHRKRSIANRADATEVCPVFETEIAPIKSRLRAAGVRRLGVFGSVRRGDFDKSSDVDVLVGFEPEARTYDNLFTVGQALEEVFQRRVDLVTEDALSPHIGPHILREVAYVDLTD